MGKVIIEVFLRVWVNKVIKIGKGKKLDRVGKFLENLFLGVLGIGELLWGKVI